MQPSMFNVQVPVKDTGDVFLMNTLSDSQLLVSTDGEVNRMKPPLHYRIRPGALRVLVPAEKASA